MSEKNDKIERVPLTALEKKLVEDASLARSQQERVMEANEQLAYHELHKMLAGQQERDLVVSRMQIAQDKMSTVLLVMVERQEVDREQIEKLMRARLDMQSEIDQLRTQAEADRARQDIVAAVLDVYTKHIAEVTAKVAKIDGSLDGITSP